jgi:hypothetical protein
VGHHISGRYYPFEGSVIVFLLLYHRPRVSSPVIIIELFLCENLEGAAEVYHIANKHLLPGLQKKKCIMKWYT